MKKICVLFAALLLLPALACGEAYTIGEVRKQVEEFGRREQTYTDDKGLPKQIDLSFAKGIPVYIPDVSALPILDIQKLSVDSSKALGNENMMKNYPGYLVIENQSGFDHQYPADKRRYVTDDTILNVWADPETVYAPNQSESANEVYDFLEKRVNELYDGKAGEGLLEKISLLSPFQDYKMNGEPVNIGESQIGELTGVGGYKLSAIETLRGIPLLCGISWAYALSGDTTIPDGIPFELLCESRFTIFYYSSQYYNIMCHSAYQEIGERLEDMPLCSFEKVVESIEQQYSKGEIDQVYSIRLGYVVFSDPSCQDPRDREEARKYVYVAVPSWVVECRLSEYADCNASSPGNTDYTTDAGYYRMIMNAQTGEVYDRHSQCEERYTMPAVSAGATANRLSR